MMPAVALGCTQWAGQGAALWSGTQRHRRRRAAVPRRAGAVAAAAADNNSAWDTLSVDELQEWEVGEIVPRPGQCALLQPAAPCAPSSRCSSAPSAAACGAGNWAPHAVARHRQLPGSPEESGHQ